jgi:hypothetical protein
VDECKPLDNGTFMADNTELTAISRKLDEVLAMAKWKVRPSRD